MIEASDIGEARILRLAHGRASALDIEPVEGLRDATVTTASDGAGAIVLTGTGHIFCAGVDLFRVADGGETYVRQYIPAFKALMFLLFTVERPLIVPPTATRSPSMTSRCCAPGGFSPQF